MRKKPEGARLFPQKIRKVMFRLTFILACLMMFTFNAAGNAQKVSVNIQKGSLEDVFDQLTRQTSVRIVYDPITAERVKIESVSYNQVDVEKVLNEVLSGTGLKYELVEGIYVISNRSAGQVRQNASGKVSGRVVDTAGAPLIGVTVVIKGTAKGAATDANGNFSIDNISDPTVTLLVTYIGKKPLELTVTLNSNSNIRMEDVAEQIGEVVVTGYQTISRERTTGSFGAVSSSVLDEKPKLDLSSALEGQVAGLNIDSDGSIAIRGVSSFQAGKAPLVVVDGFPVEASLFDNNLDPKNDGVLAGINPDNIASIYVLKDAVAASIYGARAANGVIVVTTKKGKRGKAQISYKGTLSWQSKPNMDDLNIASPADYADAQMALYEADPTLYTPFDSWFGTYSPNLAEVYYNLYLADIGRITPEEATSRNNALKGNNYLDELEKYVFRPQFTQQHNLQVTGGSDKHLYNVSANFTDTKENFKYAKNSKFIFDIGNDWDFNKWLSLSVNVNVNYSTRHTPTANPGINGYDMSSYTLSQLLTFSDGSLYSPYSSIVDKNGNPATIDGVLPFYAEQYEYLGTLKSWELNPIRNLNREVYDTQDFQARINAMLRFNIIEGLTAEIGGTWQRGNYVRKQIYEEDSFTARSSFNFGTSVIDPSTHIIPEGAILNETKNNNQNWTIRGQANFNRAFGGEKHRVTALAGMEVRKMTYDNNVIETRAGYNETAGTFTPMDLQGWLSYAYYGQVVQYYANFTGTQGALAYMDNRFVSYYGNASYEYDNKYIVSGSVRLDLTNFFGTDKKYRYKPLWSVGGTWKLSQERFFDVSFIDKLDLRASYGINGNIALDQGPFLIFSAGDYESTTGGVSYSISSPPNNQLRWEKTASFNAGIDFSMFDSRLNMSVDYYNKNSTDLLAPDNIDLTTGYSNLMINAGRIVNQGVEATINIDILRNTAVRWNITNVFSYNNNEVKTYNVTRNYVTNYTGASREVAGYPSGSLWSYRFAEVDPQTGTTLGYNQAGEKVALEFLGIDDLVFSGTTVPKFDLSLTNRFNYKNWDFSFMIVSKLGHVHRKQVFSGTNYSSKYVTERWREPGDISLYPALDPYSYESWYHPDSDIFVKKSNFLRLRDVTLAYNFDRALMHRWGLESARVFVQAKNLFLVKAKGVDIDPDASLYTGPSRPKEIYVGLQFTF